MIVPPEAMVLSSLEVNPEEEEGAREGREGPVNGVQLAAGAHPEECLASNTVRRRMVVSRAGGSIAGRRGGPRRDGTGILTVDRSRGCVTDLMPEYQDFAARGLRG